MYLDISHVGVNPIDLFLSLCLVLSLSCSQQENSSIIDHTDSTSDPPPSHNVPASAEQVLSVLSNLS